MNQPWCRAIGFCAVMLLAGLPARAEKEETGLPKVGEPAPAFDLPATQIDKVLPDKKDAKTLSLKDLKGKNVVLFFYPKALTKGCTIESCGFRDRVEKFAALDTVIVGISNDTLELQGKFTSKEKLSFPLLADTDKSVTKAYGRYRLAACRHATLSSSTRKACCARCTPQSCRSSIPTRCWIMLRRN